MMCRIQVLPCCVRHSYLKLTSQFDVLKDLVIETVDEIS